MMDLGEATSAAFHQHNRPRRPKVVQRVYRPEPDVFYLVRETRLQLDTRGRIDWEMARELGKEWLLRMKYPRVNNHAKPHPVPPKKKSSARIPRLRVRRQAGEWWLNKYADLVERRRSAAEAVKIAQEAKLAEKKPEPAAE